MAFKNKKQNKKKKNNNGYFVQNTQRFGKDFLKRKRADEIKRDAPRIFKDIAFCNGYIGSIGEYFLDSGFIKNLIIAANETYQEYHATVTGLSSYFQMQTSTGQLNPEERIQEILNMRSKQEEAYNIILTGLNNIVNELDTLKLGRDRYSVYLSVCRNLKSMSFNLKNYRHLL